MEDLNFQVDEIRSSVIVVTWKSVSGAQSYIIYVQNEAQNSDDRTFAVNAGLNRFVLRNLIPGNSYEIGSKRFLVLCKKFLPHTFSTLFSLCCGVKRGSQ